MRTKKSIVLTIILIIIIFVVMKIIRKSQKESIIRIKYNVKSKDYEKKYNLSSGEIVISLKFGDRINIRINKKSFTFRGTPIKTNDNFIIAPKLNGEYILNFSYFQILNKNKLSKIFFEQRRGRNKVFSKHFNKYNKVNISNTVLNLKKDDKIIFYSKGKLLSMVSYPVFIKKTKKRKRYIFLIGVDTLRRDHLGVYNDKKRCTPNIDKFAKDSVIFENAYSTAPWTLPAFTSMITGLYAPFHGSNYGGERIGKDIKILFNQIKSNYLIYGLTGDYFLSYRFGFSEGTDLYSENLDDGIDTFASKHLFEQAEILIKRVKNNNALFFLHTYQVHNPYNPEKTLVDELYKNKLEKYYFNPIKFIRFGKELCKKVSEKKREEIEKIYDGGIYTFDYRFGEFIKFLKRKKIYKSSMIILFADHGEEFSDHGCWEHGHSLYNELIKIPLIIKFPEDRYKSSKIKTNVAITDILPTVIDFYKIGKDKTTNIQGESVLPLINGGESKNRIIISYLAPKSIRNRIPAKVAIIKGKYKLIFNQKIETEDLKYFIFPPKTNVRYEMYDLFKDPFEKDNIFFKKGNISNKLKKIIKKIDIKKGRNRYLKSLKKRLKTLGYL